MTINYFSDISDALQQPELASITTFVDASDFHLLNFERMSELEVQYKTGVWASLTIHAHIVNGKFVAHKLTNGCNKEIDFGSLNYEDQKFIIRELASLYNEALCLYNELDAATVDRFSVAR